MLSHHSQVSEVCSHSRSGSLQRSPDWEEARFCVATAALALDCSTYQRFSHSLLVRKRRGKDALIRRAMRSQVCLFACAVIPEPNFPLKIPLFSSTNCANNRHCSSVQFGFRVLFFPSITLVILVILPSQPVFSPYKVNCCSNGWRLSQCSTLIPNRLSSKITNMASMRISQPM